MMQAWRDGEWLRRGRFVGANVAAGLVLAILVVVPIRNALAARESAIIEQRALLARFAAIAALEGEVTAAATQVPPDTGEYLVGNNEGVINADLQTRLKGMIESAGTRLRTIRTLPAQSHQRLKFIGCRIEIYGSLPTIHRAIHAIEAGRPYLFVKGAVIRPAAPTGKTDPAQEPTLEAQLDVFGVIRLAAGNP
jgi:hypothetical protein